MYRFKCTKHHMFIVIAHAGVLLPRRRTRRRRRKGNLRSVQRKRIKRNRSVHVARGVDRSSD